MSNAKLIIGAKTDVGNVRKNNEDNFTVIADVSNPETTWGESNQIDLGEHGSLLVVADGMGGMNAGEVAAAIAIEVVEELFRNLRPEVLRSTATIQNFMSSVVVEADKRIKSSSNTENRGMGTTLVMAWLYNGFAYVCWCGDSRAYLFNTAIGLRRISKDHSLVQTLVDNHKITDDEAFDSPQSNIITRCLSDSPQNSAKPENAEPVELCNGDVIMLCSDGLCGMIRDRDIVQVMRNVIGEGVVKTVDELVSAAKRAGGKDNVTVVAASITNDKDPMKVHAAKEEPLQREPSANAQMLRGGKSSKPAWMWALIGALAMAAIGLVIWLVVKGGGDAGDTDLQDSVRVDTVIVQGDTEHQPLPGEGVTNPAAPAANPAVQAPASTASSPDKTNSHRQEISGGKQEGKQEGKPGDKQEEGSAQPGSQSQPATPQPTPAKPSQPATPVIPDTPAPANTQPQQEPNQ